MAKEHKSIKAEKKKAAMSPKEKKADRKAEKKAEKKAQAPAAKQEEKVQKTGTGQQEQAHTNAQVAALQQLLLAKENEIGRLQMHLDKQAKKTAEANRENE